MPRTSTAPAIQSS